MQGYGIWIEVGPIHSFENETGMELALREALKAYHAGEFPVGCVIVQEGVVVSSGSRKGTSSGTGFFSEVDHAEIRALKHLERASVRFEAEKAVLYTTMEPCLMCLAAVVLAGIRQVVYAFEDPMGGGTNCDFSRLNPLYKNSGIKITGGVLRQKSLDLFYKFFNKEDNLYWKGSFLETYTLAQYQGNK